MSDLDDILKGGAGPAIRALAEATAVHEPAAPRPGPVPIITLADVESARSELVADGLHSGEREIAKRLGVSRDAVRYALGKDRPS